MSESIPLLDYVKEFGFPIAVAVYLIWDRSSSYKKMQESLEKLNADILEIVKQNTAAFIELRATIEKLCDLVNGKGGP